MTNKELIELLQQGKAYEFNQFRAYKPDFKIDLRGADLSRAYLLGVNFTSVDLRGAVLQHTFLNAGKLRNADLRGADLRGADVEGTDLTGAIFDKQQIAMLPELLGIKVIEDKND